MSNNRKKKNRTSKDNVLVIPAFWVDNSPFPSEEPIETTLGQVFYEGFDGPATHFGWMDLVQLNAIIEKRKISRILLQNLDVVGRAGFIKSKIIVCTAYKYNHHFIKKVPGKSLKGCIPSYTTVLIGGWDFFEDEAETLPFPCQEYMRFLLVSTQVKEICYLTDKFSATYYFDERGIPSYKEELCKYGEKDAT